MFWAISSQLSITFLIGKKLWHSSSIFHYFYFDETFCLEFGNQTSSRNRILVMEYQIGNFFILNLAILFSYWQKTRFICYITLICCELNFFVLAGWAGTAKKICNLFSGNWRSHKSDCHCSEILFTFV